MDREERRQLPVLDLSLRLLFRVSYSTDGEDFPLRGRDCNIATSNRLDGACRWRRTVFWWELRLSSPSMQLPIRSREDKFRQVAAWLRNHNHYGDGLESCGRVRGKQNQSYK